MSVRQTVSDSKAKFHKEFDYVIPALYRRIVDEFIVELNLLHNQKDFKIDSLFAFGLVKTYRDLTKGYKPEAHTNKLFSAICNSTNFDPAIINEKYNKIIDQKDLLVKHLNEIEHTEEKEIVNFFVKEIGFQKDNYYSRLSGIGLCLLIEFLVFEPTKNKDKDNFIKGITKSLDINQDRLYKDINLYTSNIDKVKKMEELIKINIAEEAKRRKSREEKKVS